jgi:hypothetical protein
MLDPTKPFEGDAFKMSPTGKQTAKALGLTALGVLAGNPLLGARAIYDAIVKPKSKNVSGVSEGYVNHIEQQANAVSSGQYGISGSPFGSVDEAKAISQYGFMSEQHMDAVERSMESQLASSGSSSVSGGSVGESWQSPPADMYTDSGAGGNVGESWQSPPADMYTDSGAGGNVGESWQSPAADTSSSSSDSGGGGGGYASDYGTTSYGGEQYGDYSMGTYAKGGLVKRRKKKK